MAGGVSVGGSPGEQQRDPGQFPRDSVGGRAGGGGRRLLPGRRAVRHEVREAAHPVLSGPSDGRAEQVTDKHITSACLCIVVTRKYVHGRVYG